MRIKHLLIILLLSVWATVQCHAQKPKADVRGPLVYDTNLVVDSAMIRVLNNANHLSHIWIKEAERVAQTNDEKKIVSCLWAFLNTANGNRTGVRDTLESAINHFASRSDSIAIKGQAIALCIRGFYDIETQQEPTDRDLKHAERLAKRCGSPLVELASMYYRSLLYLRNMRYVEAAYCTRTLLARCGEVGKPAMRFWARMSLLQIYSRIHVEAAAYESAVNIEREPFYKSQPTLAMAYYFALAEDHYRRRLYDKALELSERADFIDGDSLTTLSMRWKMALLRGKILIANGKAKEAEHALVYCQNNIHVVDPRVCDAEYSRYHLVLAQAQIQMLKGKVAQAEQTILMAYIPTTMLTRDAFATQYNELLEQIYVAEGDYANARRALDTKNQMHNYAQLENARIRSKDMEIAFREDTTVLRHRMMLNNSQEEIDDIKRHISIWLSVTLVIIIVVLTVVFLYNRGQRERRRKREEAFYNHLAQEVERHTAESVEQNEQIKNKNKYILDSQTYARRMQRGLMPNISNLKNLGVVDSFKLMSSTDNSHGSFYSYRKLGENKIAICCANTGWNGVPGAMLTMVGISLFNDVVNSCFGHQHKTAEDGTNSQKVKASHILSLIDHGTITRLPDQKWRNSMEMSVTIIDTARRQINFASAQQPALWVHNGKVLPLEAGEKRVGDNTVALPIDIVVNYSPTDKLFLFSTAVTQIIGGRTNTELGFQGLSDMIGHIVHLPPSLHKEALLNELQIWKSGATPTEDMLIIGLTLH